MGPCWVVKTSGFHGVAVRQTNRLNMLFTFLTRACFFCSFMARESSTYSFFFLCVFNQQPQQDPNQWNGSFYGYTQSYDTYGYAPPQDPNMYAYATYPGYGNYQQPQQQAQPPPQVRLAGLLLVMSVLIWTILSEASARLIFLVKNSFEVGSFT